MAGFFGKLSQLDSHENHKPPMIQKFKRLSSASMKKYTEKVSNASHPAIDKLLSGNG